MRADADCHGRSRRDHRPARSGRRRLLDHVNTIKTGFTTKGNPQKVTFSKPKGNLPCSQKVTQVPKSNSLDPKGNSTMPKGNRYFYERSTMEESFALSKMNRLENNRRDIELDTCSVREKLAYSGLNPKLHLERRP